MLTVRLPEATPPNPTQYEFDVVVSQTIGLPATGSTVRTRPTGGSEWQAVLLAESLAARGFRVGYIGPFFAYALDHGVQYIPYGEVIGRRDASGRQRPTAKVQTQVLVSQRFGELPAGVEFGRVVFDLHDIPDQRLQGVIAAMRDIQDSAVVVHSEFTASLLDAWPRVSVIPCMLPDEFYGHQREHGVDHAPFNAAKVGATSVSPKVRTRLRYVYGSAAMKGLEPTLALWKQIKANKVPHFKRATLTVTSPGYDQINPKWLEGAKDVEVVTGLSPAGMQELLADSDGIFMASTYPETFGIVFHQCEVARKPARVLQLHRRKDALWETMTTLDQMFERSSPSLFANADEFVASFDDDESPIAYNFGVSATMPHWLKVLGLGVTARSPEARC